MSGIRFCATDQGRFFTSKNPEQTSNTLGFFVWRGEFDPEKIFEPRGGEKNFFRPSRGVRGHVLPGKF